MDADRESQGFELGGAFETGEVAGGLDLGPYGVHYQSLFAESLEDGVITEQERSRLDKLGDSLGLERLQLNKLEQAMIAAYEAHNRVRVVEKWEAEPRSLQPIDTRIAGEAGQGMLLKQIERLNARIAELEASLREARAHVNVEVDLSGLEEPQFADETIDRLRARVRRDPTNSKLFKAFFAVCKEQGNTDGAYCAAQALGVLGAANAEQQALVLKFKRTGLINPQRALTSSDWQTDLNHPELDVVATRILGLAVPAALVGRAAALRREKKLPDLSLEKKQDLTQSTVMAARALGWAAAVLGMPPPPVYVNRESERGYVHVPALPPFTLVGQWVLSGRTPLEHAFLAARHLTFYRAEFFAKVLYAAVQELEDLFLAALLLGNPSLPIAEHLKARVTPLRDALVPLFEAKHLDQLTTQFKAFVADGGRTNLLRWSESVDKTAARAGLLICDDLATAAGLLRDEEGEGGSLFTDLLVFIVSEEYASLRKQIGVEVSAGDL